MRLTYIIFLAIIMGVSGCSSQKNLVQEPPFGVSNAYCTPIIGGREESGMGFNLEITIDKESAQSLTFNEVYFRGQVLASGVKVDGDTYTITSSYQGIQGKPDIVMSSDPYEEVGNQPPTLNKVKDFPFSLEPDEAVLSYVLPESETVYYTKISDIIDKPARVYPSKPAQ